MNKNKIPTNKSFAIVFFVFFLILSLFFYFNNSQILSVVFVLISLLFLLLGIINSKILTPINKYWTKLGYLLGQIISPIILFIIYAGIVFPTSLILRIFNKDILDINNKKNTYWKKKVKNLSNMDNQF